jgi:hypothetical protein
MQSSDGNQGDKMKTNIRLTEELPEGARLT